MGIETGDLIDNARASAFAAIEAFASRADYDQAVQAVFGQFVAREYLLDLAQVFASGGSIDQVVSPDLLFGADGAFDSNTGTILLSAALAADGSSSRLADVLIEEFGHYVDSRLGVAERPGDEGQAFRVAVRGESADAALAAKFADDVPAGYVAADGDALEFAVTVSDSGGYEGSSRTLQLEAPGTGTLTYYYEHYTIPDRFIIRYEGNVLLDTGFVGGSRTGTITIPKGTSTEIEIRVATEDAGTAWDYSVTANSLPDISPFTLNGISFTYSDTEKKAIGSGTATLGREDGASSLLQLVGASIQYDSSTIGVTGATVFSTIGNVSGSLFTGGFDLSVATGTTTKLTDNGGDFKLAGLDVDFVSMTVLKNSLAFDVTFKLPDQATGLFVDTLKIVDDALVIDSSGPSFRFGGKLNLPDVDTFRFFNLVDAKASGNTIEYRAGEDAIRLQSKIELSQFAKFGDALQKATFDLSGDKNYVQINSDLDVELVGSLKAETDIKLVKGWGLSEIELTVDTTANKIGGSATVTTPFGMALGGPATIKPELDFITSPSFQLNSVGVSIDNLNKPIPSYPAVFFQGIAGKIENFAPANPADIEFSGTIKASLGPQLSGNSLGELDLTGKITPNSITGGGELRLLNLKLDLPYLGEIAGTFIKSTGSTTIDWKAATLTQTGRTSILSDFIVTNGTINLNKNLDFGLAGNATIKIGTSSSSGQFSTQFTNDGNYSNDYAAAWGDLKVGALGIEFTITGGFRVNADGTTSFVGAGNIPPGFGSRMALTDDSHARVAAFAAGEESFQVDTGEPYLLLAVGWTNASSDVKLVVTTPGGLEIHEEDFAANGIDIVEELSTSYGRFAAVINPEGGTWKVGVEDATGLGDLTPQALVKTEAPTFEFADPAFVTGADGAVTLNYAAADSDSDANVTFYYTPTNDAAQGLLIGSTTEQDGTGSFVWNTTGVAPGSYYVFALLDDGVNPTVTGFSTTTVTISAQADAAVTLSSAATEILPEGDYRYTLAVSNAGSSTASGLVATVTLDSDLQYVASSVAPVTINGNELIFNVSDLVSGANGAITIDVRTSATSADTTLSTTAQLTSASYDPNTDNNYAVLDQLVGEPDTPFVNLQVATQAPLATGTIGSPLSYTLAVTNAGTATATNVVLDEYLPGFNNVSITSGYNAGGGHYQASIGSLAPGEVRMVTVSGTPQGAGDFNSSSFVQSTQSDFDGRDNETSRVLTVNSGTISQADVSVTIDGAAPDSTGRAQLVVSLTNSGPGIASNMQVKVGLPAGVTVNSSSSIQGSFNATTGIWDLGNLRDGLTRDLTLNVTGTPGSGVLNVSAELTRVDEPDPDSAPNNHVTSEDDYDVVSLNFGGGSTGTGGRTYVFGQMTQADATRFASIDTLSFRTESPANLVVTQTADHRGVIITDGQRSLTFDAAAVSQASLAGRLSFASTDHLLIGSDRAEFIGASVYTPGTISALYGFGGNDSLAGGSADDRIFGGEGDDRIIGASETKTDGILTESDYYSGGAGSDTIFGGSGNDHIYGNALGSMQGAVDGGDLIEARGGGDYVNGNAGDDTIDGGAGDDRLFGGAGNDRILGGEGSDSVNGNLGDDVIDGGAGNDRLRGGAGNDTVSGGEGDDMLLGDLDHDYLSGGIGADTIEGGSGNDHIYGNALGSTQGQVDGNDFIDAGDGEDYVNGNAGDDIVEGGQGNDRIYGGAGNDRLSGGADADSINGNLGNDVIDGGTGNDSLRGGGGNDTVAGGDGNDVLLGDLGNDFLVGGAGIDTMTGGEGADIFYFASGDAAPIGGETDVVTDYTSGVDTIRFSFGVSAVLKQAAGSTYDSVAAAQSYAQQALNASVATNDVAAVQVGADTYLFYNASGSANTIDAVIRLADTSAASFQMELV